ncbi:MAG: MerR family transcriptional regulator [Lachnospiraceae bacterium]|nr:MerR family transcriptional regulator [Lachnospiraceae bacterium]
MMDKRYMISDASKMVDVESHVLRYWEEELLIEIPRNEMGHRYYTDFHIELMKKVKDLKERGFQLKAIRMLVPELCDNDAESVDTLTIMKDELGGVENINMQAQKQPSKMEQFEAIIGNIVSKALKENNTELGKEVSEQVSDNVIKEIDYMLRLQDEREEERFRKFDEILRNYQTGRKEISSNKERKSIIGFIKKGPRTN